jgi:virginiamycin B lyase
MALPANAFPDPNFEYDIVGNTPNSFSWSGGSTSGVKEGFFGVGFSFPLGNGKQAINYTGVHDGTTTAQELFLNTGQTGQIPVTPGLKYTVDSVINLVTAPPEGIVIKFEWLEIEKETVISTETMAAQFTGLTGEKKLTSTTGVAPAKAAWLRIVWSISSKIANYKFQLWMDKFVIGEGATTPAYVDGDTDGYVWTGTPGLSVTEVYVRLSHPGAILPAGPQLGTKYTLTGPDGSIATFNDPNDVNFVGSITEITGLDSPEVRENAENIVGMDGGIHGNFYHGRRPITISGTIYNVVSNEDRNFKVTKLLQASNAMREDAILEWTPDGGERQFVKVRRQQPVRVTGGWSKSFQLLLVAADPRIYSTKLSTTIIGATVVKQLVAGILNPGGIAVNEAHVHWSSPATNFIGRSTLSGTSVEAKWIGTESFPYGVAIDSTHVYWVGTNGAGEHWISRATIAGGTIEQRWVKLTNIPTGIAVDSGHIYWCNNTLKAIGRCTIAGATVEETWLSTFSQNPIGVCVDAGHIYWANRNTGTLGRATISGTNRQIEFIKDGGIEPNFPCVNGSNLYWCCYGGGQIRRSNLEGGEVEEAFLELNNGPFGSGVVSPFGGAGEPEIYVANWNEGTITKIRSKVSEAATNQGSEITYPLITVTGKLRNFSIINETTKENVQIEYKPNLPVIYAGGLPSGISYVANDGIYFYYVYGKEHYGKININGTESNPTFGTLSAPEPYGLAVNGTHTYTNCVGTSKEYDIFTTPKSGYTFEPGIYFATLPEETFGLGVNEANIYFGSQTVIQRTNLTGGEKVNLISGANMQKGTSILVTASKLYWVTTAGEIKSATLAGTEVKTIVSGTKATSIAVDGVHMYWTNKEAGTIGRSTLAGSEVEEEWVTGQSQPNGIFVNSAAVFWVNTLTGTLASIALEEPNIEATIDMLNRTVKLANGASIYGSVNFAQTEWFGLVPGNNRIICVENTEGENLNGKINWRSAWI